MCVVLFLLFDLCIAHKSNITNIHIYISLCTTQTKKIVVFIVCVCAGVWPEVQLTVLSHIDAACLRSAKVGKFACLECQNRIAILDMSYAYTMYRCDIM